MYIYRLNLYLNFYFAQTLKSESSYQNCFRDCHFKLHGIKDKWGFKDCDGAVLKSVAISGRIRSKFSVNTSLANLGGVDHFPEK